MQQILFNTEIRNNITEDLFEAYFDCRSNKRNTVNAVAFEKHFEHNLFQLEEEIINGRYEPQRSIAFIVNKPVKREVFAADFRDRVVHHFLINKLNPLFEALFINDSYACRIGKGTHFGISRINSFIQSSTQKYTQDAYILKLDVQGFFMHIDRNILYKKLVDFIEENYNKKDKLLVLGLVKKIVFNDPTKNCIIKGSKQDWKDLPDNKSLFKSPVDCGLPIGNLSSQVFANFYLHGLDDFIKTTKSIIYYGRYVDDFVIIHQDKDYLKKLVPEIAMYLKQTLWLTLHPNKIYLQHYRKGVKFLGAIIKPNRIYIANRTKGNFFEAIKKQNVVIRAIVKAQNQDAGIAELDKSVVNHFLSSMNAYLGLMKHYQTYKLRKRMIKKFIALEWLCYFFVNKNKTKFLKKKNANSSIINANKYIFVKIKTISMKFILSIASAVLILMSCSTSPNNTGGSTTTVIPLAPSNLTGVLVSSSQVNLTWTDNSTNETGFKIERRLDGGNFAVVGTANADVLNYSDAGLAANTNYTYRVVSFNAVGSSLTYSNVWSINTGGTIPTGSTVTICAQVWMTKNLDVSTYRNGDAIPQVTDPTQWANLTTGAWCYYNNDAANGPIYGKLYNWYAVNDPRGLAPQGWHVPSDVEWTTLETCLGGSSIAGGAMKEAGLMHWLSPNTGATNSSGFAGLPGGFRNDDGTFGGIGYDGYWLSSTEYSTSVAWDRYLYCNVSDVDRNGFSKSDGFSVRCLRD